MRETFNRPVHSYRQSPSAPSRKRPRQEPEYPTRNVLANRPSTRLSIKNLSKHLYRLSNNGWRFSEQDISTINSFFSDIKCSQELQNAFKREFDAWVASEVPRQNSNIISFLLYNLSEIVIKITSSKWPRHGINPLDYLFVELVLCKLSDHARLKPKSIAMAILSTGKLARNGYLEGHVSANVMARLFKRLDDSGDGNSQEIANALLGAGYLAKKHSLTDFIEIRQINFLLNKLISRCYTPHTSQHIANALLGVGYIANDRYLKRYSYIDAGLMNDLLLTLFDQSYTSDDTPQHIANALLGVGYIAKERHLKKFIKTKLMNDLLQKFFSQVYTSDDTSLEIANALLGVGYIANECYLEGYDCIDARIMNGLLYELSRQDCSSQVIASALLGVGYIVKKHCLTSLIAAQEMNNLLEKLSLQHCNSQVIANALLGVGYIAKEHLLNDSIASGLINHLLLKLFDQPYTSDDTSQAIANALLGVGYIANDDYLKIPLDTGQIRNLLNKLSRQDCDSQAIANALLSVGYIAKKHCLNDSIAGGLINDLLLKLFDQPDTSDTSDTSQAIANALLGVGYIAKEHRLTGLIVAERINDLLQKFPSQSCPPQEIANALLGVGYITKGHLLKGSIAAELINNLLLKLFSKTYTRHTHQNIANALLGVGYIAKGRCLNGSIAAELINDLLLKLFEHHCTSDTSQEIANALLGIGYIANKKRRLTGLIVAKRINDLLQKFSGQDCNSQEIANALLGVGYIAKEHRLKDSIVVEQINGLLQKLSNQSSTSQEIANALLGVGYLAEAKAFGTISTDIKIRISSLIEKASSIAIGNSELFAKQILFCLRALSHDNLPTHLLCDLIKKALANRPHLDPNESIRAIELLVLYRNPIRDSQEINDLFNSLITSLSKLPRAPGTCLYDRFIPLLQQSLDRIIGKLRDTNSPWFISFKNCFFLPPAQTPLVHTPAISPTESSLSALDTNDHPIATQTAHEIDLVATSLTAAFPIANIPYPSTFFSPNNTASATHSSASSHSITATTPLPPSLPRQFPPSSAADILAQQIFDLITENKLTSLKELLGYRTPSNINANYHSAQNSAPSFPAGAKALAHHIATKTTNSLIENGIKAFFEHIPYQEFASLLQEGNIHDFLFVLLDTCKGRTFYELARTTAFRQFYHMPATELQKMTAKLISPLTLYRDSRALVNAIAAISLHPDYFEKHDLLFEIQLTLLDKAIKFHEECNHHNVLQLLNEKRSELKADYHIICEILEEEDEDTQDSAPSSLNGSPSFWSNPTPTLRFAGNHDQDGVDISSLPTFTP